MKVEIGESLGYSYLRHIKHCWLTQTNWKASQHWPKRLTDQDLEAIFSDIKRKFDLDGSVFKKTANVAQFMRQGEIDVVGIDCEGAAHAIDIAFHESGLNYGVSTADTRDRVLKKCLRTMLMMRAYHTQETKLHVYFLSPKVNPSVQGPLEAAFAMLRTEYPDIEWNFITNGDFHEQVMQPTLDAVDAFADNSELFVRSAKLLELARQSASPGQSTGEESATRDRKTEPGGIQAMVKSLMQTVLEDYPTLLGDADIRNLMSPNFCKDKLGLQLGGFALLRKMEAGRKGSDTDRNDRYYVKLYAGRFYVCSQWWRDAHLSNAGSLLRFVDELVERNPNHPSVPALEHHKRAFRDYIR